MQNDSSEFVYKPSPWQAKNPESNVTFRLEKITLWTAMDTNARNDVERHYEHSTLDHILDCLADYEEGGDSALIVLGGDHEDLKLTNRQARKVKT